MVELVEYIARNLVEHPDSVVVHEEEEAGGRVLYLSVAESDMGRVIGKHGRIAKALRTVVKAVSSREPYRYTVEIVENSGK